MTSEEQSQDHAWVKPYLSEILELLGCYGWHWDLAVEANLYARNGAREFKAAATCDADWPYMKATITIDEAVYERDFRQPNEYAKKILIHESLHVLLSQLAHAMETVVNVYFPAEDETPSDETKAFTIYADHEEHVVTRLTPNIYEALELKLRSDDAA